MSVNKKMYDSINLKEIIFRLREACHVPMDKDLANIFGISQSDFAQRKRRGTLLPMLIDGAINANVNLHWLLTGRGDPYLISSQMAEEGGGDESSAASDNPELVHSLARARMILTSGNQLAIDALERNILYFSHAVEAERRLGETETRLKEVEERLVALEELLARLSALKSAPDPPDEDADGQQFSGEQAI